MKNLLRFSFFLFSSEIIFFTLIKKAASFVQPFFHLIYFLLVFPKIDLAKSKNQVLSKTRSHSVTALSFVKKSFSETIKMPQMLFMTQMINYKGIFLLFYFLPC